MQISMDSGRLVTKSGHLLLELLHRRNIFREGLSQKFVVIPSCTLFQSVRRSVAPAIPLVLEKRIEVVFVGFFVVLNT